MRTKRSIKDSLKEYLNWCVGRLLLGGSRDDTVRDMVDAISDEIASGGGVVSQDQLDQTVKDITKSYGIADQTVLTSAEQYTDQKIADVVDGSPEALDTLYELAKALRDDPNFATTVMDQIGQKLPTTTFENFIDNKAWTKDNLTKLSQLINNINSIKAGTRVESMDVNLASISSYLEYDLFDNNTTGTKPPGLTTGFLLTFSWDNGGWGAQIATSDGNVDGAIFLRTIKASESDKIWGPWVSLYNTANFNPDNYLLKTANAVSASKWATARTLTLTGSASGNVSMDGSANVSLSVTNNRLNSNSEITYGWNGLNYFNTYGTAGAAAKTNDTPTTAWWHILRFNHGNSAGYYTDLAVPFNDNTLHYKRVTSGTLQNGGWVKIWDARNSNLSTVDWAAKNITAAGTIVSMSTVESRGNNSTGILPQMLWHLPNVSYTRIRMASNGGLHILNGGSEAYQNLYAQNLTANNTVTATKLVIGGITIDVYNGALRVNGNLVTTGSVTAYQ